MLKLILLSLSLIFVFNCTAQYTAADYYNDTKLFAQISSYKQQGKIDSAIVLMEEVKKKLLPQNKSFGDQLLKQYDSSESRSLDPSWILNLKSRLNDIKPLPSPPNKDAIEKILNALLAQDKALVKYKDDNSLYGENGNDSLDSVRREITSRFDSVCEAVGGWPSSYLYSLDGSLVLLLLHNGEITKNRVKQYYTHAAELCLQEKESWNVAIGILGARKQYFGSDVRRKGVISDTLFNVLNNLTIEDNKMILPYLVWFASDLSNNGRSTLRIITNDRIVGEDIKWNIMKYKFVSQLPEELLKLLKEGGFDYPKELTEDRILIEVDSKADQNVMYKFQYL